MTLQQKIAEKDKLTAIDSSIESLLKILRQELEKRKALTPGWVDFTNSMVKNGLDYFEDDFNTMKGRTE